MRKFIYLILCFFSLMAIFIAICFLQIPDLKAYTERSKALYDTEGNLIAYDLTKDGYLRLKTTVDEVAPLYIKLLLSSEDKRFYYHLGVDPISVARATISNLTQGKIVSGASTIAMQTVRNLDRKPRSFLYKLKQALGAIGLILKYGHDEVLNIYLSTVPLGGNLEGVKAASLSYFGHLPNHLSATEAALLVAIPRAPELIRPDKNRQAAIYYRNDVLRLAKKNGVISQPLKDLLEKEDIHGELFKINQDALCLKNHFQDPLRFEYHTTLDPKIMSYLKTITQEYLENSDMGESLSLIVIDNLKHEVVGYIGSANTKSSLMDLPHKKRSPGSTLKPFIYAKAFENKLLHPNTIIYDYPHRYGVWDPKNYSRTYLGEVSAKEALARSLNLPVLAITEKLSAKELYKILNKGKKRLFLPPQASENISIALGGASINLFDLTALYASLETLGMYHEPRLLKDEKQISYRIFDKKSAFAVSEILKNTKRVDFAPFSKVSYKTGTSYHYSDAYAIGSLGIYTVGVWVGRADGRPLKGKKNGFLSCAPYLFKTLHALPYKNLYKEKLEKTGPLSLNPPKFLRELKDINLNFEDKLHIDYPYENAIIMPDENGLIHVQYHGEIGEVSLFVDGEYQENLYFKAQKPGFYTITLSDSKGQSAQVNFKIEL